MIVQHTCGHEVNIEPRFAPFIRKTFCDECKELALKLQREQSQRFAEALKED